MPTKAKSMQKTLHPTERPGAYDQREHAVVNPRGTTDGHLPGSKRHKDSV
jgi:hypothetical protein